MSFRSAGVAALAGALLLLLSSGCGKGSEAPPPVSIAEAPAGVKSAFAGSSAGLKQAADEAAQGIANGDYVDSLGRLQDLSANPELTPEQRRALAESQQAVMIKLAEAAAAGDAKAAESVETHRARK
jgi:hypothetical protein